MTYRLRFTESPRNARGDNVLSLEFADAAQAEAFVREIVEGRYVIERCVTHWEPVTE